jgi:hypothetical protein
MTWTSNVVGCLRARLVMSSSLIPRTFMFCLPHVAIKRCAMEAVPIGCTQLSSRDRYLIHETQDLFCYIVRGVLSPLLANIYLDKLDKFVETTLVPTYTRGERRRVNPPSGALQRRESELRKRGQREQADNLRQQKQLLPSLDPHDPNYRRIRYLRYADDVRHLTGC